MPQHNDVPVSGGGGWGQEERRRQRRRRRLGTSIIRTVLFVIMIAVVMMALPLSHYSCCCRCCSTENGSRTCLDEESGFRRFSRLLTLLESALNHCSMHSRTLFSNAPSTFLLFPFLRCIYLYISY